MAYGKCLVLREIMPRVYRAKRTTKNGIEFAELEDGTLYWIKRDKHTGKSRGWRKIGNARDIETVRPVRGRERWDQ